MVNIQIPTLEDHKRNYNQSDAFPADLAELYTTIAALPWHEYFVVFKHSDLSPLDLIGNDLIKANFQMKDIHKRWAGKCARTIMEANGYQIERNDQGQAKTKRSTSKMFSRVTCYKQQYLVIQNKKYCLKSGSRLTDCCGAYSTYVDDDLCCKQCYELVEIGEGDGSERITDIQNATKHSNKAVSTHMTINMENMNAINN